jgi:two-component system, chemotaxis family, CheB/CheR fusion protein
MRRGAKAKAKVKTRRPKAAKALDPVQTPPSFPIVGIGASAGGLEAFTQLLGALPPDTGMAFVLIQHLDPTHPSLLAQALTKATRMRVEEIQDGVTLKPDQVYVIAPNTNVGVLQGAFTVLPREHPGKLNLPVDFFFRSLAAERRSGAIGIVLSGTASDGTEGLRAIKAEGGVTLVQDPRTAKFGGMPQSALTAGVVDLSLPIPELANELQQLARHPYLYGKALEPVPRRKDAEDLKKILLLVRNVVGVDLTEYKETTIRRRLARRLALHKLETFADYAKFLQEQAGEARALFDDVLIHVTSFFRDPEVFEALTQRIFPSILKHKRAGEPIRMWVPGCSTGQEVYSLAMALLEALGDPPQDRPIQIFGSDISTWAIDQARAGVYPESAVADVSPTRLRRFFTEVDGGQLVNKTLRAICVFVQHDLARDPPFSRLDLVSCRNVLIYFNQPLQKRLLTTFHYCLKQPGFLILGHAETVSGEPGLFLPLNTSSRIFTRVPGASNATFEGGPAARAGPPRSKTPRVERQPAAPAPNLFSHVDHLLLAQYAPPGVIVNERGEILQFRGRTGPYLESPPGRPQPNLLKMAREGLLSDVQLALGQAKKAGLTVRRDGVRMRDDGGTRTCNIVVVPVTGIPDSEGRLFAVMFEEVPSGVSVSVPAATGNVRGDVRTTPGAARLEHELKTTKDYLQSLIAEHQTSNDALASANEELVSSNEELQSLNEEIETAKEELESANEELITLNDELQHRNLELNQVNNDLGNLLTSVEIPVVIVDAHRRIRRSTPRAAKLMNVLPADVGRPISDIRPNVMVEHLDRLIDEVIATVTLKEAEVQDREGRWYRMQIRPYKTTDNRIDGAVISFFDVDTLKRAVATAEWARDYAASIVEAVQVPLVALDETLAVKSANGAFYDVFDVSRAEVEGRNLFELGNGQWDTPTLRATLSDMLAKNTRFHDLEVEAEFPRLGQRTMSLSARPIRWEGGAPAILLAIEDITDRAHGELARAGLLENAQQAEAQAEEANRAKDRFLAVLSHELRTPLSSLLLQVELLRRRKSDDAGVERATDAIERAARIQAHLIEDLLDVSRIVSGKLEIERQPVNVAAVVHEAIDLVSALAAKQSVTLEAVVNDVPPVWGDPVRLRQVVWNLLINAIKFTPERGRVSVTVEPSSGHAQIRVSDTGIGMEAELIPHVFDPFTQGQATGAIRGGLGLGLAIVSHLVERHGGTVRAESPGPGKGATFTVRLPLIAPTSDAGGPARGRLRQAHDAPNFEGARILVVEDDVGILEPILEMLKQSAAEVKGATSAEDAMRGFEEFRPQLLVCDIGLPGGDGYALIRRIRALGAARGGDIPAIALTALAGEENRRQAIAAGFTLHLAKPVEFGTLAEALLSLGRRNP